LSDIDGKTVASLTHNLQIYGYTFVAPVSTLEAKPRGWDKISKSSSG
jgi:hypothetical protein